jgi:hypothetical protein
MIVALFLGFCVLKPVLYRIRAAAGFCCGGVLYTPRAKHNNSPTPPWYGGGGAPNSNRGHRNRLRCFLLLREWRRAPQVAGRRAHAPPATAPGAAGQGLGFYACTALRTRARAFVWDPGRGKRARWATFSPPRRWGARYRDVVVRSKTHKWLVRRGPARREIL